MRVTLDTNVLLSATLWQGSVAKKMVADIMQADIKMYVSPFILSEYKKVLRHDFHFNDENIGWFLKRIHLFVELILPTTKADIVKEDPDDNPIIECAIDSDLLYTITYDKHLLNLRHHKKIHIIRPDEARSPLLF